MAKDDGLRCTPGLNPLTHTLVLSDPDARSRKGNTRFAHESNSRGELLRSGRLRLNYETMSEKFDFGELDSANDNSGSDYPETFDLDEKGDEIVGRIVDVRENVGKYDKTVFEIDDGDDVWTVWLNASMKYQVEEMGLGAGDIVGFRNTGETYENDYGTFPAHEVRGKKSE